MKVNFTINREYLNSYIFSLSLFLSVITIPVKYYTSSGVVVWALYGVLLVVSLFINLKQKIEMYFIKYILFFSVFFIVSSFFSVNVMQTLEVYLNFLKFSVLPFFFFQYINRSDCLFSSLSSVAKLSFFILILSIPLVIDGNVNYMVYGVSLSSTLIFIYFNDLRNEKFNIFNFIIILIGLASIFILGNRMAFFSAVLSLFCVKVLFLEFKLAYRFLLIFICLFVAVVIMHFLYDILIFMQDFLSAYGVYSYSIQKLIMMTDEGVVSSSSGREVVFLEAIEMICNNFFLPYNVGYYQANTIHGAPYPHNLILDLLLIVGLPGVLILMVFYGRFILATLMLPEKSLKYFIITISIYSLSRLSLSGSFWSDTLFWLPFFVYFSFKSVKN